MMARHCPETAISARLLLLLQALTYFCFCGVVAQKQLTCPGTIYFSIVDTFQRNDRDYYFHTNASSVQECVTKCYGNEFCFSAGYQPTGPGKASCLFSYKSDYGCTKRTLITSYGVNDKDVVIECIRCPGAGEFVTPPPGAPTGIVLPDNGTQITVTQSIGLTTSAASPSTPTTSGSAVSSSVQSQVTTSIPETTTAAASVTAFNPSEAPTAASTTTPTTTSASSPSALPTSAAATTASSVGSTTSSTVAQPISSTGQSGSSTALPVSGSTTNAQSQASTSAAETTTTTASANTAFNPTEISAAISSSSASQTNVSATTTASGTSTAIGSTGPPGSSTVPSASGATTVNVSVQSQTPTSAAETTSANANTAFNPTEISSASTTAGSVTGTTSGVAQSTGSLEGSTVAPTNGTIANASTSQAPTEATTIATNTAFNPTEISAGITSSTPSTAGNTTGTGSSTVVQSTIGSTGPSGSSPLPSASGATSVQAVTNAAETTSANFTAFNPTEGSTTASTPIASTTASSTTTTASSPYQLPALVTSSGAANTSEASTTSQAGISNASTPAATETTTIAPSSTIAFEPNVTAASNETGLTSVVPSSTVAFEQNVTQATNVTSAATPSNETSATTPALNATTTVAFNPAETSTANETTLAPSSTAVQEANTTVASGTVANLTASTETTVQPQTTPVNETTTVAFNPTEATANATTSETANITTSGTEQNATSAASTTSGINESAQPTANATTTVAFNPAETTTANASSTSETVGQNATASTTSGTNETQTISTANATTTVAFNPTESSANASAAVNATEAAPSPTVAATTANATEVAATATFIELQTTTIGAVNQTVGFNPTEPENTTVAVATTSQNATEAANTTPGIGFEPNATSATNLTGPTGSTVAPVTTSGNESTTAANTTTVAFNPTESATTANANISISPEILTTVSVNATTVEAQNSTTAGSTQASENVTAQTIAFEPNATQTVESASTTSVSGNESTVITTGATNESTPAVSTSAETGATTGSPVALSTVAFEPNATAETGQNVTLAATAAANVTTTVALESNATAVAGTAPTAGNESTVQTTTVAFNPTEASANASTTGAQNATEVVSSTTPAFEPNATGSAATTSSTNESVTSNGTQTPSLANTTTVAFEPNVTAAITASSTASTSNESVSTTQAASNETTTAAFNPTETANTTSAASTEGATSAANSTVGATETASTSNPIALHQNESATMTTEIASANVTQASTVLPSVATGYPSVLSNESTPSATPLSTVQFEPNATAPVEANSTLSTVTQAAAPESRTCSGTLEFAAESFPWDHYLETLENASISTAAECASRCYANPACTYAAYTPDKVCTYSKSNETRCNGTSRVTSHPAENPILLSCFRCTPLGEQAAPTESTPQTASTGGVNETTSANTTVVPVSSTSAETAVRIEPTPLKSCTGSITFQVLVPVHKYSGSEEHAQVRNVSECAALCSGRTGCTSAGYVPSSDTGSCIFFNAAANTSCSPTARNYDKYEPPNSEPFLIDCIQCGAVQEVTTPTAAATSTLSSNQSSTIEQTSLVTQTTSNETVANTTLETAAIVQTSAATQTIIEASTPSSATTQTIIEVSTPSSATTQTIIEASTFSHGGASTRSCPPASTSFTFFTPKRRIPLPFVEHIIVKTAAECAAICYSCSGCTYAGYMPGIQDNSPVSSEGNTCFISNSSGTGNYSECGSADEKRVSSYTASEIVILHCIECGAGVTGAARVDESTSATEAATTAASNTTGTATSTSSAPSNTTVSSEGTNTTVASIETATPSIPSTNGTSSAAPTTNASEATPIPQCNGTIQFITEALQTDYTGEGTELITNTSAAECASRCYSMAGCSAAVFTPADAKCRFPIQNKTESTCLTSSVRVDNYKDEKPVLLKCFLCASSVIEATVVSQVVNGSTPAGAYAGVGANASTTSSSVESTSGVEQSTAANVTNATLAVTTAETTANQTVSNATVAADFTQTATSPFAAKHACDSSSLTFEQLPPGSAKDLDVIITVSTSDPRACAAACNENAQCTAAGFEPSRQLCSLARNVTVCIPTLIDKLRGAVFAGNLLLYIQCTQPGSSSPPPSQGAAVIATTAAAFDFAPPRACKGGSFKFSVRSPTREDKKDLVFENAIIVLNATECAQICFANAGCVSAGYLPSIMDQPSRCLPAIDAHPREHRCSKLHRSAEPTEMSILECISCGTQDEHSGESLGDNVTVASNTTLAPAIVNSTEAASTTPSASTFSSSISTSTVLIENVTITTVNASSNISSENTTTLAPIAFTPSAEPGGTSASGFRGCEGLVSFQSVSGGLLTFGREKIRSFGAGSAKICASTCYSFPQCQTAIFTNGSTPEANSCDLFKDYAPCLEELPKTTTLSVRSGESQGLFCIQCHDVATSFEGASVSAEHSGSKQGPRTRDCHGGTVIFQADLVPFEQRFAQALGQTRRLNAASADACATLCYAFADCLYAIFDPTSTDVTTGFHTCTIHRGTAPQLCIADKPTVATFAATDVTRIQCLSCRSGAAGSSLQSSSPSTGAISHPTSGPGAFADLSHRSCEGRVKFAIVSLPEEKISFKEARSVASLAECARLCYELGPASCVLAGYQTSGNDAANSTCLIASAAPPTLTSCSANSTSSSPATFGHSPVLVNCFECDRSQVQLSSGSEARDTACNPADVSFSIRRISHHETTSVLSNVLARNISECAFACYSNQTCFSAGYLPPLPEQETGTCLLSSSKAPTCTDAKRRVAAVAQAAVLECIRCDRKQRTDTRNRLLDRRRQRS